MSAYVLLIAILAAFATAVILITGWLETTADEITCKALNEAATEFDDDKPLDRLLAVVQSPEPLPPIDATEDEFAAYVARAVENARRAS